MITKLLYFVISIWDRKLNPKGKQILKWAKPTKKIDNLNKVKSLINIELVKYLKGI